MMRKIISTPRAPFRGKLSPIGVDIDRRSIAAVQLSHHADGWRLEAATVISRNDEGDGASTLDQTEIQRLGDVLLRQGFRGNRLVLSVPQELLLTGVLDLPSAGSGAPMDQIAKMELARMHKCEAKQLEVGYWDLPQRVRGPSTGASAEGATERRGARSVMGAACETGKTLPLLQSFEAEGWDIVALDVVDVAMVRACLPMIGGAGEAGGSLGLLNLRWDAAHVVLLHQGAVAYQRVLDEAGLDRLHRTLVQEHDLTPELATFVLLSEGLTGKPASDSEANGGVGPTAAHPLIANQLDALMRELRASCSYLSHRYTESSPRQLLFMGEGARIPGLAEYLSRGMDMEVSVASPLRIARLALERPELTSAAETPALISAIGLALNGQPCRGRHGDDSEPAAALLNLDLRPAQWRVGRQRRKRTSMWAAVAGAYAAIVLLALAASRIMSGVDSRAAATQLATTEADLKRADDLIAALGQEIKRARTTWETNTIVSDQPDWSILLAMLARSIGDEIVLRSCEIKVAAAAEATTPRAGGNQAAPTAGAAQTSATPKNASIPFHPRGGPFELSLAGLAKSQLAVSQFVVALEQWGLFEHVRLVETRREPFLSSEAIAFRIQCIMNQEGMSDQGSGFSRP